MPLYGCFTLWLLSSLYSCLLGLTWDQPFCQSIAMEHAPLAIGAIDFTNESGATLYLLLPSPCGSCITLQSDTLEYPPGSKGRILLSKSLGGHLPESHRLNIDYTLNNGPRVTSTFIWRIVAEPKIVVAPDIVCLYRQQPSTATISIVDSPELAVDDIIINMPADNLLAVVAAGGKGAPETAQRFTAEIFAKEKDGSPLPDYCEIELLVPRIKASVNIPVIFCP